MIDWKRGGWTGSLNRFVRREISEHFRDNASARRARYPLVMRLLHMVFDDGSVIKFVLAYFLIVAVMAACEIGLASHFPHSIPAWSGNSDLKPLLINIGSYLIATQVGILSVLSIAVGLVTLIAQRENASTDVQVYYHESLAFGVVASSIALLSVLCVQLLWPIQFGIHLTGYGTSLQAFKLLLTIVHISWLLLNLGGLAHFVNSTLAFVQQSSRETMRERYTANVVLPVEMRRHLRRYLYLAAGPDIVETCWPGGANATNAPTIYLGQDFSRAGEIEVVLNPSHRVVLRDVRVGWLRWVVSRWLDRCRSRGIDGRRARGFAPELLLLFPPRLDDSIEDGAGLCRRRGGIPFKWWERHILLRAFKFRSVRRAAP